MHANFAILAEEIAKRVATCRDGSPTTIIGPPTSGTRILNEFWRDSGGDQDLPPVLLGIIMIGCSDEKRPRGWLAQSR